MENTKSRDLLGSFFFLKLFSKTCFENTENIIWSSLEIVLVLYQNKKDLGTKHVLLVIFVLLIF